MHSTASPKPLASCGMISLCEKRKVVAGGAALARTIRHVYFGSKKFSKNLINYKTPLKVFLFLVPFALGALEIDPWLGNLWEFKFVPSYTYSRFREVQNGHPQLNAPFNVHLTAAGFGLSFTPTWACDVDVEFADTQVQSMGYRSSGYQIRYMWLSDIVGDCLTFTTGLNMRGVSRHSLKDISCPYHSDFNFELTGAIGKEWSKELEWTTRVFGFVSAGIANHGSPWTRGVFSLEKNAWHAHRFALFLSGYFGFGHRNRVDSRHFHGYASIHHQSFDITLRYAYVFEVWGHLDFIYTRRLYALSFPEKVNFFTINYTLPFCLF